MINQSQPHYSQEFLNNVLDEIDSMDTSCDKSFEELRATLDLMIKRQRWDMTLNTVLTAIVWFLIGYSLG